jgi:VWFA-related protein
VRTKACLLVIALLVQPCLLWANPFQDPRQEQENGQDLSVEQVQVIMELKTIQLRFLVRDAEGRFMRDLTAHDFVVTENGHEQDISLLKEQQVPISSVVMVDNSWSTSQFLGRAADAAVDFFKGLQPERSAFILFADKPEVVIDWTEGGRVLSPEMTDIKPNGKTALYDSVIWVARNMFQERTGKKLIVILTDGIDTVSKSSFQEMMKVTREAGITLYPIIYTNQYIENYRQNLKRSNRRPRSVSSDFHNLIMMQNRFVDQSLRFGGRTIFSNAFADLQNIYGDIIHEMKSQYVMLYQAADLDADKREVRVFTKRVPGRIFIEVSH